MEKNIIHDFYFKHLPKRVKSEIDKELKNIEKEQEKSKKKQEKNIDELTKRNFTNSSEVANYVIKKLHNYY